MPARKITYNGLPLSDGRYLSQHSDAEYETLRKAFLSLGEECDDLRLQIESLSTQCEDSRTDYYKLDRKYRLLKSQYDEMLEDELEQMLCEESEE